MRVGTVVISNGYCGMRMDPEAPNFIRYIPPGTYGLVTERGIRWAKCYTKSVLSRDWRTGDRYTIVSSEYIHAVVVCSTCSGPDGVIRIPYLEDTVVANSMAYVSCDPCFKRVWGPETFDDTD